ncbi:sce7726 family protein [Pseudomonas segetis]
MVLSDLNIRSALLSRLENSSRPPRAILEELRVSDGNAIADVVTIHNEAHCYEIKGDADKVERIVDQGQYYDLAFNKVTLITTKRHVNKAYKIAPIHWGITEVREAKNGKLIFKPIRPAQKNPNFDKKTALLTLWRNELVSIAAHLEGKFSSKSNREMLSELISGSLSKKKLSLSISETLVLRTTKKPEA